MSCGVPTTLCCSLLFMTSTYGSWDRSAEANFARRLRVTRESLRLSQADMADRITEAGVPMPQQTVARIEAGKRAIRLNEARIISEILKVELQEMISDPLEGLAPDEISIAVGDSVEQMIALDEEISENFQKAQEHKKQARVLDEERRALLRRKTAESVRLEALAAIGALGEAAATKPPVGTRIAAARLAAGYLPLVLAIRAGLGEKGVPVLRAIERNDFSGFDEEQAHYYITSLAHALDMNAEELFTQYLAEHAEME